MKAERFLIVAGLLVLWMSSTFPPTPDLIHEHLGPCVVWEAKTKAGAVFLKTLPDRFKSPVVEVKGGEETPTGGRAEYNPTTKTLSTPPSLQTELKSLAADYKLQVREIER